MSCSIAYRPARRGSRRSRSEWRAGALAHRDSSRTDCPPSL